MGAFDAINQLASTTNYADVVGIPIASTTAFATSTLQTFYGLIGAFWVYDFPHLLAYGLIATVLLVPFQIFILYRGY